MEDIKVQECGSYGIRCTDNTVGEYIDIRDEDIVDFLIEVLKVSQERLIDLCTYGNNKYGPYKFQRSLSKLSSLANMIENERNYRPEDCDESSYYYEEED